MSFQSSTLPFHGDAERRPRRGAAPLAVLEDEPVRRRRDRDGGRRRGPVLEHETFPLEIRRGDVEQRGAPGGRADEPDVLDIDEAASMLRRSVAAVVAVSAGLLRPMPRPMIRTPTLLTLMAVVVSACRHQVDDVVLARRAERDRLSQRGLRRVRALPVVRAASRHRVHEEPRAGREPVVLDGEHATGILEEYSAVFHAHG
jgi:hypothetical protein